MKVSPANILRIVYFLVFCCTAAWLPVLADFCGSKGFTGTQTSWVLSVTPLMMFLVQPFIGSLSDKIGYKRSLIIVTGLSSISYLGYFLEGGLGWVILITALMALFYNNVQPLLDALSLNMVKANKKFSYGSLRIAGAAGWAFTGIVAGKIIEAKGISIIFVIAFVAMFLAFLFSFFLKQEDSRPGTAGDKTSGNLLLLLQNRQLMFLLLGVVLISVSSTAIWNYYSLYMKENGATQSLVGYGLSLQGLCELPLFYFSALIIRKLGLRTVLLLTALAVALRLMLYGVIKIPIAALPVELLHGISWSLFWVACVEYVNRLVDNKNLATGQSFLYAAYFGVGTIAGNFWVGYLYDQGMSLTAIFLINAVIAFVTVLFMILFIKKQENQLQKDIIIT